MLAHDPHSAAEKVADVVGHSLAATSIGGLDCFAIEERKRLCRSRGCADGFDALALSSTTRIPSCRGVSLAWTVLLCWKCLSTWVIW